MGFSKMMELLQQKNKGAIVLCNTGKFYIARGKDAILLNRILGLKLTCLEAEVCKVGFPITSIEKYQKLIENEKYSYIVYNYDQEKNELQILKEWKGKKRNEITENKENCYICSNTTKSYKKPDKYVNAVAKLYGSEFERNRSEEKNEPKSKWKKRRKRK